MAGQGFHATSEAFLSWFKSLPGATFSDALQIVDFRDRNAGRGIVATKDIEPDTTLFTIPRKGIINVQTSDLPSRLPVIFDLGRAETETEDEDESIPPLDSWSSLILVMIYEFLRGEDSPWKPYFDVLPETFDTPMFWSDDELDELQASPVRDKIGKDEAESMFFSHIIPVIRKNSDLFPPSLDMGDEQLIALAHRMGSTIMSYAFDLENDDEPEDETEEWVEDRDGKSMMGMVPMADILNADAEFNAHVNHGENELAVTSIRPIKAGEEILNYYGPHPNSELLRRYGYVTDRHSRHDVVEIPWSLVESGLQEQLGLSLKVIGDVREKLDEDDLEDTLVLERESPEVNSDGTFSGPAVLEGLPAAMMGQVKDFLQAVKEVNPDAISDKRKRREATYGALAQILPVLESRYPTSAIDDEGLLQQESLSKRKRMAIEVRLGEKKLLLEAKALISRLSEEEGVDISTMNGANKKQKPSN